VAEVPGPFAHLLRARRIEAGLTQEELAEAAGLTSRAISYLELGAVSTPRRETVRLLAGALGLTGQAREEFETTARGRSVSGSAAAHESTTRVLPRDIASFTGRQAELRELADAVTRAGRVVSIQAIGGMAGIGKTAFAVHAAHQLAGQFPDGQIFLPLHAHTPGQQPASPREALASLLMTTGIQAAQIPASLEDRASLWREQMAGRRRLLVLDDVASSDQVKPLLPGDGGCLVLITSRRHLTALEDARTLCLDALRPEEAAELLVRMAARPKLDPADPGVRQIVQLCGFLPLAIGMVGRQLRHHPAWSVGERAAGLAASARRLELLATENV
jgi:transcriptional regulator with XRE-family HTH domain